MFFIIYKCHSSQFLYTIIHLPYTYTYDSIIYIEKPIKLYQDDERKREGEREREREREKGREAVTDLHLAKEMRNTPTIYRLQLNVNTTVD